MCGAGAPVFVAALGVSSGQIGAAGDDGAMTIALAPAMRRQRAPALAPGQVSAITASRNSGVEPFLRAVIRGRAPVA